MDPNVLNHTSFQFIRLPSYHRNHNNAMTAKVKEYKERGEVHLHLLKKFLFSNQKVVQKSTPKNAQESAQQLPTDQECP